MSSYVREERDQNLSRDIMPGLWVVGDRDQLTRLFLNLLDNATQYTPNGGSLNIRALVDNGRATVTVEDNGIGIAPEDLPHVFERFYRVDKARTNGTEGRHGLGLSIALAIAHAHGGDIKAESALGHGSRFIVTLRAVAQEQPVTAEQMSESQ